MEKKKGKTICACVLSGVLLFGGGMAVGRTTQPKTEEAVQPAGYAANPAYESLTGAAAWQMSAEAHALMLQAFHLAEKNIDDMVSLADRGLEGYHWIEEAGEKKLYRDGKRVCVITDIDDTLVDGVHYTANILGKDGEWNNKAFTDFLQSAGCTPLPGAVDFANYCTEQGVALFYVTNRYDQGYKKEEAGYGGEEGYRRADGTVIGSSTYDLFGKTMYDITMEQLASLGFPIHAPEAKSYCEDAILLVNDTKLKGSSKEPLRQVIAEGGTAESGERSEESTRYPETIDLSAHYVAMLLGDDLNDISSSFSEDTDALGRIALALEEKENWGEKWIVLPNAVYGSSQSFAGDYGYDALFDAFDYTKGESEAWEMYE